MRIASLLPSATEIVCTLGARDELVGISHECDYPPGLEEVPVLTRARVHNDAASGLIDAAVQRALVDAISIYEVDAERLRAIRPDVIVTQDLCEVCAVSLDDVRAAVARLARNDVVIVNLRPARLGDIFADVERVADAIGRSETGRRVAAQLERSVNSLAERACALTERPTVLTVEWLDPVMIGGLWMPELVTLAGGEALITKPGEPASTLPKDKLAELEPDVVLIKPCGFSLERTLAELSLLPEVLPWDSWRAVAEGRVYVADGSAYFNRPGPRIVESLDILAGCMHPEALGDLVEKHRASCVRVTSDLVPSYV
jgi:iron complex transport system substrate-binding protein